MLRFIRAGYAIALLGVVFALVTQPVPTLAEQCRLECESCRCDMKLGICNCEDCTITCRPS